MSHTPCFNFWRLFLWLCFPVINKQRLLASAPNCHSDGVKESTPQLFKQNFHSSAKESVKSRANLETSLICEARKWFWKRRWC